MSIKNEDRIYSAALGLCMGGIGLIIFIALVALPFGVSPKYAPLFFILFIPPGAIIGWMFGRRISEWLDKEI